MQSNHYQHNHQIRRGRKGGGAGGAEASQLQIRGAKPPPDLHSRLCTLGYCVNLCTLTINHHIIVCGDVTFCKINCYNKSTNRTECTFSILLN